MIYKVNYQEDKLAAPSREKTKTLYIEATSISDVRQQLETNTPYMIEFIQLLEGAHLEYEQEHNPDYEVVSF